MNDIGAGRIEPLEMAVEIGGGFPHVSTAPVVYNRQNEIRQLIIDWVTANGVIDPAQFASVDWRLVSGGQPITIS